MDKTLTGPTVVGRMEPVTKPEVRATDLLDWLWQMIENNYQLASEAYDLGRRESARHREGRADAFADVAEFIQDKTGEVIPWLGQYLPELEENPEWVEAANAKMDAEYAEHNPSCDGSITVPDAGFGGQDMTYECEHPSHRKEITHENSQV